MHHRAVGDLIPDFEVVTIETNPSLSLVAFSAEPRTPSHDGLQLLSNGAATLDQAESASANKAT